MMLAPVMVLSGCDDKAAGELQAGAGTAVDVVQVMPQNVPLTFEFAARAQGSKETEVRARVGGILLKRNYVEGAEVSEGQVLFEIDPDTYRVALNQAKAKLAQTEAELKNAETQLARTEKLFKQGYASEKSRDDAVANADSLKAALQSAQAAVDAAQLNLDYTQVKAPISGLTSMEVQSEGSLISTSGEGGLLTHITQLNPIYVMFSMSETEMMKMAEMIEKGYLAQPQRKDQIKAKLNAGDGWQYPQAGDIDFVNPTVDQETGTIKLRAVFDNPKGRIRPGQFLRLSVEGVVRADALVVPQTAVMQGANGSYVYRINAQDKIEAAPITTGFATKDGGWIVDTGLNPGDRVVVSGLLKLRPGMAAAPQIMNATSAAENNPAVKGYARAAGETGTVSDGAGAVNAAESTGAGAAGETGMGAGATTDGAVAGSAGEKGASGSAADNATAGEKGAASSAADNATAGEKGAAGETGTGAGATTDGAAASGAAVKE